MKKWRGNQIQFTAILTSIIFCLLLLSIVVSMSVKNIVDQQAIIEDSIETQLLSISVAAREIIDVDDFMTYNTQADADNNAYLYNRTLMQLRQLANMMDADYIYVLKEIEPGRYIFVFDTDMEDPTVFIEYEISQVHLDAFNGKESADIMNVSDEYGSFNTAAVPIWKDGKVVGIVATDIRDTYIEQSRRAARVNMILLIGALLLTMAVMLAVVILLVRRLNNMQRRLEALAHQDAVTGLPNRQFLMEHLHHITNDGGQPFTLFFIDLDNFKAINDTAGHDAGDESLRLIAEFLQSAGSDGALFRSSPGAEGLSARIGGDEFVQIMPAITDKAAARDYARNLLDAFKKADLHEHIRQNSVGLSIGAALFPQQSRDAGVLVKMADTAMYHSKKNGKNCFQVYDESMGIDLDD